MPRPRSIVSHHSSSRSWQSRSHTTVLEYVTHQEADLTSSVRSRHDPFHEEHIVCLCLYNYNIFARCFARCIYYTTASQKVNKKSRSSQSMMQRADGPKRDTSHMEAMDEDGDNAR